MEEKINMLTHLGIIMDGNRRWAKLNNLSKSMGHKKGAENLKNICLYLNKLGLKYLSVYAFSTENFKREEAEVNYLMDLFIEMFNEEFKTLEKENVKVLFSGRKEPLSSKVLKAMEDITNKTKNNTGCILNVCLNYGAESEIVDMTKKICEQYKKGLINLENITPELVSKNLYQDLPPLDLVIRTGGDERLSNFMLYQSSYAELYFTKTYFPALSIEEIDNILEEFGKRNRNFGGN